MNVIVVSRKSPAIYAVLPPDARHYAAAWLRICFGTATGMLQTRHGMIDAQ